MSFSREAIAQITKLARLSGENTRVGHSIQDDLSRIVKMVDQISSINTQGISPMAHPLEMQQPLRPDAVTEPEQREALLKLAPKAEAGLFLVPPVIE